jgi:RNase H-fold protein (predicted Holliday junction resolvase)
MSRATAAGPCWLAALDPGRSKCGLALAEPGEKRIVAAAVLAPEACMEHLSHWRDQGLRRVLLGNGTGSAPWQGHLQALGLQVETVNERGTTLAARHRYWQLEPPQGWRRLLPEGLRPAPRDLDDVVAQLLLERHLGLELHRAEPRPLRSGPAR